MVSWLKLLCLIDLKLLASFAGFVKLPMLEATSVMSSSKSSSFKIVYLSLISRRYVWVNRFLRYSTFLLVSFIVTTCGSPPYVRYSFRRSSRFPSFTDVNSWKLRGVILISSPLPLNCVITSLERNFALLPVTYTSALVILRQLFKTSSNSGTSCTSSNSIQCIWLSTNLESICLRSASGFLRNAFRRSSRSTLIICCSSTPWLLR